MAEKEITVEELLAYQKAGAKITQSERKMIVAHITPVEKSKTTTIAQFSDLLDRLDAMIAVSLVRAEKLDAIGVANLSREKSLEVVIEANRSAVERDRTMFEAHFKLFSELRTALLTVVSSDRDPLQSLQTVLTEIQESLRPIERPAYEFDVVRSREGFIDKIIATPILATRH